MKFFRLHVILFALGLAGPVAGGVFDPHAYVDKAATLIEAEDHALARAYLDPAVISHRLTPAQRSRAYYLRGYAFHAEELFVSAALDYAHALEFNPDNPAALYATGGLYFHAVGVARDRDLALQFFRHAAELGHPGGQLYLGNAYLVGEGVASSLEDARAWLNLAADAGFPPAMLRLAASFRERYADSPDPEQARHWYEKALAAGATDALLALGYMHGNGEFGDASAGAAVDYFKRAAELRSGPAMASLAHAYLTGNGVRPDFALARSWYLQAAGLDVPGSYAGLGHIHEAGLGVPADIDAARSWYEKGSEAGHTDALLRLLYLLLSDGNTAMAASWVQKASERDDARALNAYAWLLATAPLAGIRDGELALQHAHRAVGLERNAAYLDTLAAAYAELDRFEDAVAVQQQALAAAGNDAALIEELTEHLTAYRQARPWRQ